MIDNSTDAVQDNPTDSVQDNPTDAVQDNPTDAVQDNPTDSVADQNPDFTENESQELIEKENNDDDEFIRITAAHKILTEAQTYEEQKNYPLTLHFYRICVDLLLEELMFTEGTEQSRIYLREKCTAIMDRIDYLKTKLEPISLSIPPEQSITNPLIDQVESLDV